MTQTSNIRSKSFKATWVPRFRVVHTSLALMSAFALMLWGFSGVLHPLITTFGVQQAVFMPPQLSLKLQDAVPIERILSQAGVPEASSIRVLAGQADGGVVQPLLQVTEQAFKPRRYFEFKTGQELPDQDQQQAVFLARHFLKLDQAEPAQVEWIDSFSTDYPSVNRLLPVYKVSFEGRGGLHAYIYTETNSIAGVSDTTKQWAQTAFQWFHTWSWLPNGAETSRILLMSCLLLGLVGMGLSGLSMLVLVRRRRLAQPTSLRIHRLSACLLVLPTLGFAGSGIYHLWVMGWPTPESVIRLPEPLATEQLQARLKAPLTQNWTEWTKGLEVTGLSVVSNPQVEESKSGSSHELYYRLALKLNTTSQGIPILPEEIRHARFTGTPVSGPALYLDALTGQPAAMDDKKLALLWGQQHTGLGGDSVQQVRLITRFGSDYDFRNKRLPVWQIDYRAPFDGSVFIDTATGVLVDVTPNHQKPERWSFNTLHKWNFLTPLGRNTQNLATGLSAFLAVVFLAGLGLRLKFKAKNGPQ